MNIVIRQMLREDVPAVMEIQNWEILNGISFADYEPKTLEERLEWTCEIGLAIHRDYHRKGVGRRVVLELIERAKALKYTQMIACICGENEKSLGLFTSLGFKRQVFMHGIMHKFDRDLDEVIMQLPLTENVTVKSLTLPSVEKDVTIPEAPGYEFRLATEADFPGIIDIYNWEIVNGTLTGDTEEKDLESAAPFLASFGVESKRPLMVAVHESGLVDHKHTNVGLKFLQFIIATAKSLGFRDLLGSNYSDFDQTNLSPFPNAFFPSLAMPEGRHVDHISTLQRAGFKTKGYIMDVGEKFGKSLDIVYLQLRIE
ncbi:hypothetical protein HDU97_004401 [Phlyctochytrium planicorne]|nr:hypothetical protein HDU97_004401 [Phlyctochytrium planicorne]